jgi:hypothetical protein
MKRSMQTMTQHYPTNPEIVRLQETLKQLDAWPDAGDQFLALMPQSSWYAPQPSSDDHQLVPVVVEKAMNGSDIGAQYPAFFQKLLAHAGLRQDFLAALPHPAGDDFPA